MRSRRRTALRRRISPGVVLSAFANVSRMWPISSTNATAASLVASTNFAFFSEEIGMAARTFAPLNTPHKRQKEMKVVSQNLVDSQFASNYCVA